MVKIMANGNFRKIAAHRGHSLASLARKVDMTSDGLTKVAANRNGIRPENAQKIVKALSVKFEHLFEIID